MIFQKVKAVYDDKKKRSLVPSGEPDQHFECDDVLVAWGRRTLPWIERDSGLNLMVMVFQLNTQTFQSTQTNIFFGGDSAFGPKNIIWRWRTPRCCDFHR